jgi:hypothetical protein
VSKEKFNPDNAIIERSLINAVRLERDLVGNKDFLNRHERMLEILLTDENQGLPFKEEA